MASHLPQKTMKILKFNLNNASKTAETIQEEDQDTKFSIETNFERDIFEVIGFQNGLKPWTDIR